MRATFGGARKKLKASASWSRCYHEGSSSRRRIATLAELSCSRTTASKSSRHFTSRITASASSSSSASENSSTSRRSASGASRRSGVDYLTNNGIVEGVWMFCRHGDRAPGRCLSPTHLQHEEAAFWVSRLPYPDSESAFEAYTNKFPLSIEAPGGTNHGSFLDVRRNPFGFLTQSGLIQLKQNGQMYFQRYNRYGHHLPNQLQWRYDEQHAAEDFMDVWDINVYSTNYLRTVLSVQSFLDGLLDTNCFHPGKLHREYDPSVVKEERVPTHTSWMTKGQQQQQEEDSRSSNSGNDNIGNNALAKIRIRELRVDPLNAFDRNPDLIAELSKEVMLSNDFLKHDAAAAPLAARLANVLPGLVRKFRTDYSKRTPSGINWVEASDHFICRAAHDVGYARFTDFEDDDRVEHMLESLSHQTIAHLAWRFRKWYQHKRLLAVIAAPPLREIADQICTTAQLGTHQRRPFVVYSCHDITILGLLYGIGADFLADDRSSQWRYWPKYGSQLCFELVRVTDDGPPVTSDSSHVVRVLLNGKPVLSVDHDWLKGKLTNTTAYMGHGPERMMFVNDFMRVVKALEDAGGHDYDRLLGRK